MLFLRLRSYAILLCVLAIAVSGWLRWLALYVSPREQALAFRWAEDRWLPSLFALARIGENANVVNPIVAISAFLLVLIVGFSSRSRSHPFSWFLRPAGLLIPAAALSPYVMPLMMTGHPSRWTPTAFAFSILALLLNPVPQEPVRRRLASLVPLILALASLIILLVVTVRNLNSVFYFYSFQVITTSLAIVLIGLFAGFYLIFCFSRSESQDPPFAPSLLSLALIPIAVVVVTNLAPPAYLVRSDRVPRLSPADGDIYLQYLWAGRTAIDSPVMFEYSYKVPELEEVARRVKIPKNAPALDFDRTFHGAMADLLQLPLHTRTVREWVFVWLRYRVRHPCEPMFSTYETLIAHDPVLDPESVFTYRDAIKACETATPENIYRAVVLLLAHGFVEEAQDEARSLLSKAEKANLFLSPDRRIDVDNLRERLKEAEAYFGEDSRKVGGILGSVVVDQGALKPGIGIAASVKIGVSLYYPRGLPFLPASAYTGYVEPDANGAFQILDLPIRDYAVLVVLRKDSFQTDVSVEVNRPLIRLTTDNYTIHDLVIRIKPGGDFFRNIEARLATPATLSQDALKEIVKPK